MSCGDFGDQTAARGRGAVLALHEQLRCTRAQGVVEVRAVLNRQTGALRKLLRLAQPELQAARFGWKDGVALGLHLSKQDSIQRFPGPGGAEHGPTVKQVMGPMEAAVHSNCFFYWSQGCYRKASTQFIGGGGTLSPRGVRQLTALQSQDIGALGMANYRRHRQTGIVKSVKARS